MNIFNPDGVYGTGLDAGGNGEENPQIRWRMNVLFPRGNSLAVSRMFRGKFRSCSTAGNAVSCPVRGGRYANVRSGNFSKTRVATANKGSKPRAVARAAPNGL